MFNPLINIADVLWVQKIHESLAYSALVAGKLLLGLT